MLVVDRGEQKLRSSLRSGWGPGVIRTRDMLLRRYFRDCELDGDDLRLEV